jgi:very-short-patch-repair endonuclease
MLGWPTEVVVRTGHSTTDGQGFPPCYKLDIGNPTLKIGIEINGRSHCALERQQQDVKKRLKLESLGWQVLSFSNAEVLENPAQCVGTVMCTTSKSNSTTTTSPKAS